MYKQQPTNISTLNNYGYLHTLSGSGAVSVPLAASLETNGYNRQKHGKISLSAASIIKDLLPL